MEVWDDFAQDVDNLFLRSPFLLYHEDGVISCDGSQYLRNVAVVDVVGDAAGISWPCLDDHHVA